MTLIADPRGTSPLEPLSAETVESWRGIDGVLIGIGRGTATAHHGELLQGQIHDAAGVLHRCLLSLPCTTLYSRAVLCPDRSGAVRISPPHKTKALTAIRLTLEYLGASSVGGTVTIESNIIEGKGYGSSTADCVASIRAVMDALGQRPADEEVATLAVRSEAASDNTMFDQAVLFAQRDGIVLERYARPVPAMDVLGFDVDPTAAVDTLKHPPAVYSQRELELFQMLVAALRRAIRTQDGELLGRIATASATVNERFLPKRLFNDIRIAAEAVGAAGVAVAHSGTVVGILVDCADPRRQKKLERLRRFVEGLGASDIRQFTTRGSCVRAVA